MISNVIVNLFPTYTTYLFAIYLAMFPSWSAFGAYIVASILGGFVSAVETMATDNFQLASLQKGIRELGIPTIEAENFSDLLPAAGVNYLARRLSKERRPNRLFLFYSPHKKIKHAIAFNFRRFYPICFHSIGKVSGRKRQSMILYHEVGHLFFMQPRGGYVAVIFGSFIPLLWIAYVNAPHNVPVFIVIALLTSLEILSIMFLNRFEREVFADMFALASKFTELWDHLSQDDVEIIKSSGQVFDKMPKVISMYKSTVNARSRLRGLIFQMSYKRMNKFENLHKRFLLFYHLTDKNDLYWKEVFYRKAFLGVVQSPRSILALLKIGILFYIAIQLPTLSVAGSTLYVLIGCAILVLLILVFSNHKLDKVSGMRNQAEQKESTSVSIVIDYLSEKTVAINQRIHS